MCAPRLTRHTSIRYSSSCHKPVNMGASIFFTAAMIRAFRSSRSRGNDGKPRIARSLYLYYAVAYYAVAYYAVAVLAHRSYLFLATHLKIPRSIPGHSAWDSWRSLWQWDRFISKYFGVSLSASFHLCSTLIVHSITVDAI
jgi:hypothetical protein